MRNTTTPTISALESIDFNLLASVSGGCGGKKHHCCQQAQAPDPTAAPTPMQCQIMQLPAAPAQAPAQQMSQDPMPQQFGPQVSTSVTINGQPAA